MNTLIKLFINNEWIDARPYQKEAFLMFKNNNEMPIYYNKDGYKISIQRISNAIYMIREDTSKVPINDWNNVYVFLLDKKKPDWYPAKAYQKYAYFDYLYSDKLEEKYMSKNSNNVDASYHLLPFDNIDSNIIFKLSGKSNGNIYYEKNDKYLTRVRISDNIRERLAHSGMYNRMTESLIIINARRVITTNPTDWFHSAFGFIENCKTIIDYHSTFEKMYSLYEIGLKKKINGINIGDFKLINLVYIKTILPQIIKLGNVTVNNIIIDIVDLHKTQDTAGCTIQVASQLNCLEMINSNTTPEHGITIYQEDKTQGPLCVMCTPAGIAYRSYILYKQLYYKQIDMSKYLLLYLKKNFDHEINWTVINGYLKIDSIMMLEKINKILRQSPENKNNARNQILAGMHNDLGVYIDNKLYIYHVNHVLCSGLPISYHTGELSNADTWGLFAEIFLEAYYELTLLIACYNNKKMNTNKKCYLTKIGGGVFGMNNNTIIKAIKRAIKIIKNRGYDLEICIVHYKKIDSQYLNF